MITPKAIENSSYRIMCFRSPSHLYDDHDAELLVSIFNISQYLGSHVLRTSTKSRFNILVTSTCKKNMFAEQFAF
jgi:hypothetical protein